MTTDTGDCSWDHLEDTEHFGRASSRSDFTTVPKEHINDEVYSNCTQAGHCMIYAKCDKKVFGVYKPRAAVLMQMRFDGYIGFPGGLIDEGETVVYGLNRELKEEVGIDTNASGCATEENYVVTHYDQSKKLLLHFYAVEVPYEEFKRIEHYSLDAHEHGTEVLGTIRVPLYTMGDGYRGFPNFLTNKFIGNAREQLLQSLVHVNLMTSEEIALAEHSKAV